MQAPIHDSILELRWIEFILAQTGLWNYDSPGPGDLVLYAMHIMPVVSFLATFVGHWPSRNERSRFTCRRIYFGESRDCSCYHVQIHFRCFARVESLPKSTGTDGFLCQREQGQIASTVPGIAPCLFEERRISILGIMSDSSDLMGTLNSYPAMFRALILAETGIDFSTYSVETRELKWRAGLEGTIAFHAAIFATVRVWEIEWNSVLDQVDDYLGFQLSQTMSATDIRGWMFDDDFGRSSSYFTILQVLRIFADCIRTVSADLHTLDDLFLSLVMAFRSTP